MIYEISTGQIIVTALFFTAIGFVCGWEFKRAQIYDKKV